MGKGDKRRPTEVPEPVFANNWCRAFGHKFNMSGVCRECGITEKQVVEADNPYVSRTDAASIIPNIITRTNDDS